MTEFTHFDKTGQARMVDVGSKELSNRTASAVGRVLVSKETLRLLNSSGLPKGNPFEVARIAGIQAAKATSHLIPLCHNITLDYVDVEIRLNEEGFQIGSTVSCRWATGVEMEALTAVAAAALTLYDMCKAVDKALVISDIRLVEKRKEPLGS